MSSRIDSQNAALSSMSAQALIEGGAQLIPLRFAGQPDLQAELYGVVGGVFSDTEAYKLAADYATLRGEAFAIPQADPMEQAAGALALGRTLFDDRRYADADAELRATRALDKNRGSSRATAGITK